MMYPGRLYRAACRRPGYIITVPVEKNMRRQNFESYCCMRTVWTGHSFGDPPVLLRTVRTVTLALKLLELLSTGYYIE